MGIHNKQGFTIIEVMLFLSISGALTIAVLVGAGTSIAQQRYRDSVNSLASFLQQQYTEVTSVRNDRDVQWTCGASGVIAAPTGGMSRGTTDCAVLGKYISLNDTKVTVRTVVGRATVLAGLDDVTALKNSNLTLSDIDRQEYTVEWGAKMQQRLNKNPIATTIVIARSPTTGSIRTFIDNTTASQSAKNVVADPQNLQRGVDICVYSDGLFGGKRFDVEFVPNSSGTTGVRVNGDSTTPC